LEYGLENSGLTVFGGAIMENGVLCGTTLRVATGFCGNSILDDAGNA
jgi:hypothetical protein